VLSAEQDRIDVEITVTDPLTLLAPAVLKTYWRAYDGNIRPYDCQAEE
jgi:hypothetical protein